MTADAMARWRWLLVALVLVVAGAIAVWPRGERQPTVGPPPADPAAIAAARQRAALPPCQPGEPGAGPANVRDTSVSCLGDGSNTTLADALGDGPVLVNLWATWCQPCREELPLLAAYAAEPGAIRVVTVATSNSEPADALDLLATLGVRLPSLLDVTNSVPNTLNITTLPASFLVTGAHGFRLIEQPRPFTSLDQIRAAVAQYGESGSGTG
jgi:thiol-disulfide isomerase/thioredoxin